MARSTDDSDDRRKRRPKDDPDYDVLPDDDDEEGERPRPRRRRRDEDDYDRPRRRRRPRPGAFPTRPILGILCGIATPLCALAAIRGTIRFFVELSSGNWSGIGTFVATVILVVLAKLYGQAALVIWQGNADEYDFRMCGIASFAIGGISSLPMCFQATGVLSGRMPSSGVVAWMVTWLVLMGLWVGIGVLSFIEAGVFKGTRRK
jgi:hypothetical protein